MSFFIKKYKNWLLAKGWLDASDEEEKLEKLKADILAAVKAAEVVEKPPLEEIITDVYYTPTPELEEQLEQLKEHVKKYPDAYPITSGRL